MRTRCKTRIKEQCDSSIRRLHEFNKTETNKSHWWASCTNHSQLKRNSLLMDFRVTLAQRADDQLRSLLWGVLYPPGWKRLSNRACHFVSFQLFFLWKWIMYMWMKSMIPSISVATLMVSIATCLEFGRRRTACRREKAERWWGSLTWKWMQR